MHGLNRVWEKFGIDGVYPLVNSECPLGTRIVLDFGDSARNKNDKA
jgi:hypothetical protein